MGDHELEAVREQLRQSDEWQYIIQRLNETLKETPAKSGRKNLSEFSAKEKTILTRKAAEAVQKTDQYASLQHKSFSIVEQTFPPVAQEGEGASTHGEPQESVIRACCMLLTRRPDLRRHLKRSINLPLPHRLRYAAWSAFLHDPLIREDVHLGLQELSKREASLAQQCDAVLQSKPLLAQLRGIPLFTQAMAILLKLWQRRTHSSISDRSTTNTILLTVPFLYISKDKLTGSASSPAAEGTSGGDSKELNQDILSSTSEMFVYFMEMLPVTTRSNSGNEVVS